MMLLTFLKLVVGQLDDPYRVEAERMRRLTASRAKTLGTIATMTSPSLRRLPTGPP